MALKGTAIEVLNRGVYITSMGTAVQEIIILINIGHVNNNAIFQWNFQQCPVKIIYAIIDRV